MGRVTDSVSGLESFIITDSDYNITGTRPPFISGVWETTVRPLSRP